MFSPHLNSIAHINRSRLCVKLNIRSTHRTALTLCGKAPSFTSLSFDMQASFLALRSMNTTHSTVDRPSFSVRMLSFTAHFWLLFSNFYTETIQNSLPLHEETQSIYSQQLQVIYLIELLKKSKKINSRNVCTIKQLYLVTQGAYVNYVNVVTVILGPTLLPFTLCFVICIELFHSFSLQYVIQHFLLSSVHCIVAMFMNFSRKSHNFVLS